MKLPENTDNMVSNSKPGPQSSGNGYLCLEEVCALPSAVICGCVLISAVKDVGVVLYVVRSVND